MENISLNRREFLKKAGLAGATAVFLASPWLSVFSDSKYTDKSVVKLGIIGPGSRGRYLTQLLANNKKADVIALCDIYQPSLDEALKIVPNAKTYKDYRHLL